MAPCFSQESNCQQSNWAPETPHNLWQLQRQSNTIMALLKRHTHGPPIPTDQALNQPIKACQIAMRSAALLPMRIGTYGLPMRGNSKDDQSHPL
jgi:hypothetical protein